MISPPHVYEISSAAGLLFSAFLGLSAIWCLWSRRLARFQEKRLNPLKAWRIVGYFTLAASQGALVFLDILTSPNGLELPSTSASIDQWAALGLWILLVVSSCLWPSMLHVQML